MKINSDSLTDDLPSLPQVLLHIVETLHREETGLQDIADLIQHDAALTLRVIAVANSGQYGRAVPNSSLQQSIVRLGIASIRSIILAIVFRQFVEGFQSLRQPYLRIFWRDSLTAAHFSRNLAKLLGYAHPEEAFLAGLLMNCGELVLASRTPAEAKPDRERSCADQLAQERELFGTTHAQLGADMALRSGLSPYLADALWFHHEPMESLRDAHRLVQIVALSSEAVRLRGGTDEAWTVSDGLFGLNQSLLAEMLSAAREEVARLAGALNLQADESSVRQDVMRLQEMLGIIGQAGEATRDLWQVRCTVDFEQRVERCLALLMQIRSSLLFCLTVAGDLLEGGYGEDGEKPAIVVDLAGSHSQLVKAFKERTILLLVRGGASVLDQQLIRRAEPGDCYAVPLVHDRRSVGVLALGVTRGQPFPGAGKAFLFDLLRQQIAGALQHLRENAPADAAPAAAEHWQQRVREAIHEAGNPLSIIRNYLDVLRMRIGDQTVASGEIALIGEEIDRIGSILLRLRDAGEESAGEEWLDVSEVIGDVAEIFQKTLCTTRKLRLTVDLPSRPVTVRAHRGQLKQVLVNLLKNAVEASPEGGNVGVAAAWVYAESGAPWGEITIVDEGRGLPEPVMARIFQPVTSTKGEGHSGLGLSITKKLVDQMGGRITCKTGAAGTRFQILLPRGEKVR